MEMLHPASASGLNNAAESYRDRAKASAWTNLLKFAESTEFSTSSSSEETMEEVTNETSAQLVFGFFQNFSSSLDDPISSAETFALTDANPEVNDTMTENYWPLRDPLSVVIPITVIYILILVVGILGNVVTCVVIVRSRYLHTTTNYYLFSLAVSDLLLLLSGLPAEMHSIWRRYPDVFGEAFCIGRGFASELSANATVLTITAFTVERYLAICRPFFVQKWQNKLSRIVKLILVIWAVSIALAIPQALQLGLVPMPVRAGEVALICSVKNAVIEHSFEIATLLFFVAPMILISVLYCLIGLTLHNSSHVQESKLRLRKSLSAHSKREIGQQRVLKMLVAVVAAFFICWAPFHAQRLIAVWGTTWLDSSEAVRKTYHVLTYVSGVLYYVSTCINPILYHIMSLKFRHAFQIMVNGCISSEDNERRRREMSGLNGGAEFFERQSLSTKSSRSANVLILTEISSVNYSSQVNPHHAICNNNITCHNHHSNTKNLSPPRAAGIRFDLGMGEIATL